MADARLRQLERAAAAGGPREREALRAERDRLGLPRGFDDGPWLPAVPAVRGPCALCNDAQTIGYLEDGRLAAWAGDGMHVLPVSAIPCDACHATMRCRWRCTHPVCVAPVAPPPPHGRVWSWLHNDLMRRFSSRSVTIPDPT